jgi:tetrahydromethanopterin S-methyltransferase subunit G
MEQLQQIFQELNSTQRDVAVLGAEVQNFKKVMDRLDEAITAMSRVSSNLERLLIIHEERIKSNDTNLAAHKAQVEDTFVSVKARLLKLEDHKELVNKWRWQLIGAWSVIAVLASGVAKALHVW